MILIFFFILFFFLLFLLYSSAYSFPMVENFQNLSISVLILSYQRPHNLKFSLSYLRKIPFIHEIIILHGKKEFFDDSFQDKKIIHIRDYENNKNIFTLRRFHYIPFVKNEFVLLLDDDIYPKLSLLKKMLKVCSTNRNACTGPFGRSCTKTGYKYRGNEYLLTPILMARKKTFLDVWEKMKENNYLYDLVIQQKGNCEDLFFQYEYRKLFHKNGIKVKGPYKRLDFTNGFSTTNWRKHYQLRNNFCKLLSLS